MKSISVIIPTYRRPKKLLRLLRSIQLQTYKDFEVIVVDNDADSEIRSLIRRFNKTAKFPVRYISEPHLGLHNARHAGAKKARGSILIFGEDEITFTPDWIKAFADSFKKYPAMVAAGGPLKPKWEVQPAQWVRDLIGSSKTFSPLSLIDMGKQFFMGTRVSFFGGNMAIRKETLYQIGGFNPETFGDVVLGDGDTGINRKLRREKMLIGYVPNALIYHHIDRKRMEIQSFIRWMENTGRVDVYSIFQEGGVAKNWISSLKYVPILLFINLRNWLKSFLAIRSFSAFLINLKLQSMRTFSQIKYMYQIGRNPQLQKLITKKNWI